MSSPVVGQSVLVKHTFSQSDFDRFAALSGDDNPIHVDPAFAAQTRFGATVAHGMFLYANISAALGTYLPGPGTVQLEQELVFPAPTYAGVEMTLRLEVTALPAPCVAEISATFTRPDGTVTCTSRTVVLLPGQRQREGYAPAPAEPPAKGDATYRRLALGQHAALSRSFSAADLLEYRDLSGDTNPLYADPAYARLLGLPAPPVPGPLLGGLISNLLGTGVPGRGTMWLKQRLLFPAFARTGEEIGGRVEIVRLRSEKKLAYLTTVCTNADSVVATGEALVFVGEIE